MHTENSLPHIDVSHLVNNNMLLMENKFVIVMLMPVSHFIIITHKVHVL